MNPLALSAAGALGAVAAGVLAVLALYLLKPPLRRLVVPSRLIWDRVLEQTRAGRDRLRWWLSFLLAAAVVASILLAVTRPQALGGAADGRLVLVLDNSPTMATFGTDGRTRWDHAVERAREIVRTQPAGTRIWIADSMRRIAIPQYEDRDAALGRLDGLRVTGGGTPRMPLPPPETGGELLLPAQVVVLTDGVQLADLPAGARVESLFEPVQNAGITAFELRAVPGDPRRVQAFVEVTNGGGGAREVALTLAGVGGRTLARKLALPASGARAELVDVSGFESGPVRAALVAPGDGLAIDDAAYAWLPVRRVLHVTLVSGGNPWLEKALQAQPRVELRRLAPERYADDRQADVWVFDRFAPGTPPAAPALLFRPGRAGWLPATAGDLTNPTVSGWDAFHPLLENVSLQDLYVEHARKLVPAAGDTVLVTAGGAPIAWARDAGSRRVGFSFALEESNFALHAAFPVFLGNALGWMAGEPTLVRTGLGAMELPLADARVVAADGRELSVRPVPGGSLVELDEPGFYTAVTAQQRLRVAVNVLDRKVTEVNRSGLAPVVPQTRTAAPASPPIDAWLLLMLAALALLAFEWWSWNRRLTL
jgi:hypothetical protein